MKKTYWVLGLVLVFVVAYLFMSGGNSNFPLVSAQEDTMIYKSSSCGCCKVYGNYYQKSDSDAIVKDVPNLNLIKEQYGVPAQLESCHTTIVGDYFVEGHIPLEVVERLLEEQPDIRGIAMPGMPQGSPGMPGSKEPFKIYKVNNDGTYELWIEM